LKKDAPFILHERLYFFDEFTALFSALSIVCPTNFYSNTGLADNILATPGLDLRCSSPDDVVGAKYGAM